MALAGFCLRCGLGGSSLCFIDDYVDVERFDGSARGQFLRLEHGERVVDGSGEVLVRMESDFAIAERFLHRECAYAFDCEGLANGYGFLGGFHESLEVCVGLRYLCAGGARYEFGESIEGDDAIHFRSIFLGPNLARIPQAAVEAKAFSYLWLCRFSLVPAF